MTPEEMISEFLCPGCTNGTHPCTECPDYEPNNDYGHNCEKHSPGTFIAGIGAVYLGLPKGFNRVGLDSVKGQKFRGQVRLWTRGTKPDFDHLNVPVWAMEKDGRTYSPRVNLTYIDVIEGGKFVDVQTEHKLPYSVRDFIDDID